MPTYVLLANAEVLLRKTYRFLLTEESEQKAIQAVLSGRMEGVEVSSLPIFQEKKEALFAVTQIQLLEEGRVLQLDASLGMLLLEYGKGLQAYFRMKENLDSLSCILEIGDLVGFYAEHGTILHLEKWNVPPIRTKAQRGEK